MFCQKCHAGNQFIMFPLSKIHKEESEMRVCPQCRTVSDQHLMRSPLPPPGSSSLHKRGNMKKQEKQTEESFHADVAAITGGSVKAVDLTKIAPSID